MSKYAALREHLETHASETVRMTFAEIEKVLGFKLPRSQKYPAWWSNNPNNNVMTNEWLAAGYKTEQVDIEGRKLLFRRTRPHVSSVSGTSVDDGAVKRPRRHPLFGWLKGTVTIAPGTDLTAPADPEWGEIAWGKEGPANQKNGGEN